MNDPLAFMNNNIIVVSFEGADKDMLTDAPLDLCLMKRTALAGTAKQMGRELGLFALGPKSWADQCIRNIESTSRPFKSYFCPYRGGSTFGTTIGSKADYMFTTQMDGCSLGIGAAAGDGTRLVFHANNGGNVARQEAALSTKFGGGAPQTTWSPASYRMEFGQSELCSTTFGVRDATTGLWHFYAQTYQRAYKQPDAFFLRQVKTIF